MIDVIGFAQLRVGSPLSYVVAFALPALDAVLPVVPSESAVVALGVASAGSRDPMVVVLVALAALGAFVGDNVCYVIGRRFGPWAERRFFASDRGRARRAWADRALERYGTRLIVLCRFVPGGRTAVTLTCGVTGYRRRSFVVATAVSAVLWATYAFLIGRLGGEAFKDQPWIGLLLALGIVVFVSLLVEVARRAPGWWRRWRSRSDG